MKGSTGKVRTPDGSWRASELTLGAGDASNATTTALRIIPFCSHWRLTSAEDIREQARALSQASLPHAPQQSVALAPSGWLRVPWSSTGLPGPLASGRDAGEFVRQTEMFVMSELGTALALIPARMVVFGVDLYDEHDGHEVQFMLVFSSGRIIHTTSKFSGRNWSAWLCSIRDLATHLTNLPLLGRTVLLNCDDLAAVRGRKLSTVKDHEWRARIEEMRRRIVDHKPESLIHIAHHLGSPGVWRPALSEVRNQLHWYDRAATTGRYDREEARGHPAAEYVQLVRDMRDLPVMLKLSGPS